MRAVYGLYPDGHAAQQAVNRLRAAGLADREITILSAQPMEDFEFGHIDKANWLWWIACGGGLVGMSLGFFLTWLTETSWPMNVGGLPTELVPHFFRSLADSLGAAVHVCVQGENTHHMVEACFKGTGRALRQAVRIEGSELPSSKGVL